MQTVDAPHRLGHLGGDPRQNQSPGDQEVVAMEGCTI